MTYLTREDADVGVELFDSIQWAFEEHVRAPDTGEFNFAVLYGNEDAPLKIEFWRSNEPKVNAKPDFVWEAK